MFSSGIKSPYTRGTRRPKMVSSNLWEPKCDAGRPVRDPTYAVASFPEVVRLCKSSIPGEGYGVCGKHHIPAGTWIGPYEGRRVEPHEVTVWTDTSYMWEVSITETNTHARQSFCGHLSAPIGILWVRANQRDTKPNEKYRAWMFRDISAPRGIDYLRWWTRRCIARNVNSPNVTEAQISTVTPSLMLSKFSLLRWSSWMGDPINHFIANVVLSPRFPFRYSTTVSWPTS